MKKAILFCCIIIAMLLAAISDALSCEHTSINHMNGIYND